MGAKEMKTRNKLALGGALLIFGYFVVSSAIFSPESSPYTRGRTAAVELGCLACHASGAAPSLTVNPDEPSEKIPPLIGCELTKKDFTTWVLKGRPDTAASGPLPVEGGDAGAAVMPAYEDEHGTYIMNSKDLRAVQHVEQLTKMGIHSLKIEGRTKSHYYVARTAQVYRKAIDNAISGEAFDHNLMGELEHLANRGYTEGFYRRHVPNEYQNYEKGFSANPNQQFVGEAIACDEGVLEIDVKNYFEVGDLLELITPLGNQRFLLEHIVNKQGEPVNQAPGSGHVVRIPLPPKQYLPQDGGSALLMRHK